MRVRVRPGRAAALLVVVASAVSVVAQTGQAPSSAKAPSATPAELPTARQIIDRYVAAIGGRAAILRHTSMHAIGMVAVPSAGMAGTFEVFAAKPDKTVTRITLGGIGDVQEGFDGRNGWSISAMTGPTLLQGKELEQRKFDADYYGDLKADDKYESMTTVEKANCPGGESAQSAAQGRACYKVRLVRKGGGEDFEFYDVETGLKAGGIATRDTPMGAFTQTTIESDYRQFGGIMQPTTIRSTIMGLQQVITIASVEFDKVDPVVFEPPAPIKALLK
jgi:zinc protease